MKNKVKVVYIEEKEQKPEKINVVCVGEKEQKPAKINLIVKYEKEQKLQVTKLNKSEDKNNDKKSYETD